MIFDRRGTLGGSLPRRTISSGSPPRLRILTVMETMEPPPREEEAPRSGMQYTWVWPVNTDAECAVLGASRVIGAGIFRRKPQR
jgi:hypothetical protein